MTIMEEIAAQEALLQKLFIQERIAEMNGLLANISMLSKVKLVREYPSNKIGIEGMSDAGYKKAINAVKKYSSKTFGKAMKAVGKVEDWAKEKNKETGGQLEQLLQTIKYLHDLIRSELAALDGFRDAVQPLHPDKPPINKRTIRYARSSIIIKNSILKHLRAEEKTVADLIAQLREYAAQQQAAVA